MENSTKAILGLGALSFLACSGNPDMNEIGSKKDLEECEKNLSSREEVDACKSYKTHMKEERETAFAPDLAIREQRSAAGEAIRACTSVEQAHVAKALALSGVVTTMGKDSFPTPKLSSPQCSGSVNYDGGAILGFVTPEQGLAVTPDFFEVRNAGCDRATTLYTLALCQQRGDCMIYDGPATPSLPYKVKDATTAFMALCEEQGM